MISQDGACVLDKVVKEETMTNSCSRGSGGLLQPEIKWGVAGTAAQYLVSHRMYYNNVMVFFSSKSVSNQSLKSKSI